MKILDIDEVTTEAVNAALAVVDRATLKTGKRSQGPLGDDLAYQLHRAIETAIREHMNSELAPVGVAVR
jgi:hypothetical protein